MSTPTPMTPPLNAKGLYTVTMPFELAPNTLYTCKAIRSYADLIDAGVDIYTTVYAPLGLVQANYQADLAAGANLITLMSATSATVHVPDTYITAFPDLGIVPYSEVVLALSLTPVPDSLDLTFVKQQVANAASDAIGLTPTVTAFVVPLSGTMTKTQADAAESARQAAITNRTSDYAKLKTLQQQYAALQQQYAVLEQMVINAGLVTPSPAPSPTPTP